MLRKKNRCQNFILQYFSADFTAFNENKEKEIQTVIKRISFKDSNVKWSHLSSLTSRRLLQREGENFKYNLESVDAATINWPFVSYVLFICIFAANIANAGGIHNKTLVAGFHLFVYSFSSIILNKLPLEICLVSWDRTALWSSHHAGSAYQLMSNWDKIQHCCMISICHPHIWVANISPEPGAGVWRSNCVAPTTHTHILTKNNLGQFSAGKSPEMRKPAVDVCSCFVHVCFCSFWRFSCLSFTKYLLRVDARGFFFDVLMKDASSERRNSFLRKKIPQISFCKQFFKEQQQSPPSFYLFDVPSKSLCSFCFSS